MYCEPYIISFQDNASEADLDKVMAKIQKDAPTKTSRKLTLLKMITCDLSDSLYSKLSMLLCYDFLFFSSQTIKEQGSVSNFSH